MDLRMSASEENLARSASDINLPHEGGPGMGLGRQDSSASDLGRVSLGRSVPYTDKLESLASSAVRAADKVGAKLIIVFTESGEACSAALHTPLVSLLVSGHWMVSAGRTAGLVSKYRPPVPILTLVVPTLKCTDGLRWTLEGRATARQCLVYNGLLPVLAAPSPSGANTPRSGFPHSTPSFLGPQALR